VTDRADNGNAAVEYGSCHRFLVKRLQIFQGAAPATDNQYIEVTFTLALPVVGILNGGDNLHRCLLTLYGNRQ